MCFGTTIITTIVIVQIATSLICIDSSFCALTFLKTDVTVAMVPPKAPAEVAQPQNPKVELRNKPPKEQKSSISPSKKAEFRQSGGGDSPIPKRAKFIKKFSALKAASKEKKKTSSTKLTAEGGKVKKSEKKLKKSVSSSLRKESVTKEKGGKKRKVSKTNVKQAPEPKQETSQMKVDDLEPQKLQEPVGQGQVSSASGNPQAPPTSYEVVAEMLADKLVRETISTQSK